MNRRGRLQQRSRSSVRAMNPLDRQLHPPLPPKRFRKNMKNRSLNRQMRNRQMDGNRSGLRQVLLMDRRNRPGRQAERSQMKRSRMKKNYLSGIRGSPPEKSPPRTPARRIHPLTSRFGTGIMWRTTRLTAFLAGRKKNGRRKMRTEPKRWRKSPGEEQLTNLPPKGRIR